MNDASLPEVGDVYETNVKDLRILLCVRRTLIPYMKIVRFDFLVLDGGHPSIRSWTSGFESQYSMEETMSNFKFVKII